ncbi:damage-inducible protein CinA [Streptococcus oralis]|uniref:damage-inducible protein CinA n=1 Tax=Streptococcus oralis TaxID=1303 RepID=UPI0022836932|nr:damage-inducible protein CinA [Streptococcus oralis]MCY7097619.1 damage-inducible protein CinA [Streptococcus oralis]
MNVYGKIDEKQEGSHYQDWSAPEKREGAPIPFFSIMLWSLVATAISVVLPFIFGLVSPQQTQDLYTGWALNQNGQMYTDYFGTNGLLYYLLTYLSLGSILLALVEWLALFGAGVFLFKSADALTGQAEEAKKLVFVFYLLVAGLAFGGGYALLLALPFLFYSLSIVTNYLAYPNDDKGFVRVGMSLALAFFLAPIPTALFAAVLALGIIGFNLAKGHFVHGLYQFFASALGFSLLFYPLGYYTVWTGSFGDAISQTLYPVNTLSLFSNAHLLENAAFYGLLAVGLGSLSLLFTGLFQSKPAKQYALSIAASLGLLVSLGILILSNEPVNGTRLAILLPFLILLLLTGIKESASEGGSRRRRREKKASFIKGNFYLPLIALAYLIALPILSRYLSHPATYQERERLASVVKQQTSSEDRVYAWDDRPDFYRASERLAPTSLVTPTLYTASDENKTKLMNDLKENQPKMIMVNQKVALWSDVESWLSEKYELVQIDTSEFKLYKSK